MSRNVNENYGSPGVSPSTSPEETSMKTNGLHRARALRRKLELLREKNLWDFDRFELERSSNRPRNNERQQETRTFPLHPEHPISNANEIDRFQQPLNSDDGTQPHVLAIPRCQSTNTKTSPNSPGGSFTDPFYQSQSSNEPGSGAWATFIRQTKDPVQHLPGLENSRWADDSANEVPCKLESERPDVKGNGQVSGVLSTMEKAVRLEEREVKLQEKDDLCNSVSFGREGIHGGHAMQMQQMRGEAERRSRVYRQGSEQESRLSTVPNPSASEPSLHRQWPQERMGEFARSGGQNEGAQENLSFQSRYQRSDAPRRAFPSSREPPQRTLGYRNYPGR